VPENTADVAPGVTVTEAGTFTAALLLARATTTPPAGAGEVRAMVQLTGAPPCTEAGEQVSGASQLRPCNVKVTDMVTPPAVAVTVAVELLFRVPVSTVKDALEEPAATVTAAGADRLSLLETPTVNPPAGAGWFRVTAQTAAAPLERSVGLQVSEESEVKPRSVMVKDLVTPPPVAETVAVEPTETAPAVAVKGTLEAPAGTVTSAGRVKVLLLLTTETVIPPAGAA